MAGQKRAYNENATVQKSKKMKATTSESDMRRLATDEMDFPRGGGTTFTPAEVKTIRAEAVQEAEGELFKEAQLRVRQIKKRKRPIEDAAGNKNEKNDVLRIEKLNYKRLAVGMKILGQIVGIEPLAIIISLPNQLCAHVPITNISTTYTKSLEAETQDENTSDLEDEDEPMNRSSRRRVLHLSDMFHVGQFIRAIVVVVHPVGSTTCSLLGKVRDEVSKASLRVELTLDPTKVNSGVSRSDLKAGFTLSASIKSVEDHGYILDVGIPDLSGFLPFQAGTGPPKESSPCVGQVIDVVVAKIAANGRTCHFKIDQSSYASSALSEVSSASSLLPGMLVQTLVTGVQSHGLNLQVAGFFDGTVDEFHLPHETRLRVGEKVKARVLYVYSSSPPRFALALNEHIIKLQPPKVVDEDLNLAYPIGTILEEVQVLRVEPDRAIVVKVDGSINGFVHISQISDDRVPTIATSGPYKVGTIHRARVTGYFPFDGLLQLTLKKSILATSVMRVNDLRPGEIIKGTIKGLTDAGLFVSISSTLDGVIWPNHYADIVLKHPGRRFKPGASIKCRVLVTDSERCRVSLTAKRSLLESTLPILASFDDVKQGVITHAVVFKVHHKHLMVEFYNNLKAIVPLKEASDTSLSDLVEEFPIGKVVKVRILTAIPEGQRITASIRQALIDRPAPVDVSGIEIGNIVEGEVSELHKDNVILSLRPSKARALISLKNVANHMQTSLPRLRNEMKLGEVLTNLVVVNRNVEEHFVIVANKPKPKAALSKNIKSLEDLELGQVIQGRIMKHTRQGTFVKVSAHVGGLLHPTDVSDDYDTADPYPSLESVIKAAVIAFDISKRQLTLSTRASLLQPAPSDQVVDRLVTDHSQLKVGDSVRGFIKSVIDHGLFVTIGRNIDARVQIRELFDEYIKDWQPKFKVNQLVKGRILSVNIDTKQIEMSLRSDDPRACANITTKDLKPGQKLSGTIRRVEEYGLFIQIDNSKLSGLCHKSELADNADADVTAALRGFREGDKVKAYLISIDDRRVSLSLRPSYFKSEDEDMEDSQMQELDEDDNLDGVDRDNVEMQSAESSTEEQSDEDDQEAGIRLDREAMIFPTLPQPKGKNDTVSPLLRLSGGFKWSGNTEPDKDISASELSSDEEGGGAVSKRKKKRKQIEPDLTADLDTKTPGSNADFERLLLGSPNSSFLWVQYMSFQLQLSEVQKARDVARRAVKTIDYREEQERLNIWIALLNLENVYGTEETLDTTFKEAARANEAKTVYLRLAAIFDEANAPEKAENQFKRTTKKFGKSSKVWTLFAEHYLRRGEIEETRKLLPRSLQSLEKRKHLKTISRFAQLEYRLGEPERGKTLFEGIINSHPKRWDIWSIYMDMETGQGDIQSLRNLFNRVLTLKMTSHKAKAFFKKWLGLERRLGDEEGEEAVRQTAIEWTQKAAAAS